MDSQNLDKAIDGVIKIDHSSSSYDVNSGLMDFAVELNKQLAEMQAGLNQIVEQLTFNFNIDNFTIVYPEETPKDALQKLRLVNFVRGQLNKLIIRILCLIARTSQVMSNGKGIEGFIAYKTWARPPSTQLRVTILPTFINQLSRPGHDHREISYGY